jgi:hypothetical protein
MENEMKRQIERWKICNPSAMITDQSEAAAIFAMEDARHDILELNDEVVRLKSLLRMAAYPRRGTDEESLDIFNFANVVQSVYTSESLGE